MAKWNDAPLFRLALAACAAMAAATAMDGLALGVATGCVLIVSGVVAALLDQFVDEKSRTPLFLLVSAVFAGIAWMLMKALCAETALSLGIYVPLIAVNCLLLARPACEIGIAAAVTDGVKMALGFVCTAVVLGAVREICSVGTVFGAQVLPRGLQLSALAAQPAGGVLLVGLLLGVINAVRARRPGKEDDAA